DRKPSSQRCCFFRRSKRWKKLFSTKNQVEWNVNMKTKLTLIRNAAILLLLSTISYQLSTCAQGTAFTYQGRLIENGFPVNRTYDLIFRPWNAPAGGTALTVPYVRTTAISNGLFTTTLDFGSGIFSGDPLWLEIQVSTN